MTQETIGFVLLVVALCVMFCDRCQKVLIKLLLSVLFVVVCKSGLKCVILAVVMADLDSYDTLCCVGYN